MKSKFLNSLLLLVWIFFSLSYVNANEAFVFNVAEIEILEDGNKINGTNGGKVISDDGSTISGNNFFYNKQTNILKITDNVKYLDNVKNIAITADKIIYYKNDEKIFTIGNSKVIGQNNNIRSDELEYDKNLNTFKAIKNAEIHDFDKDTKIYANEISYIKDEERIFTKGKTKALVQKNINLIQVTLIILEIKKIYFLKKKHQ